MNEVAFKSLHNARLLVALLSLFRMSLMSSLTLCKRGWKGDHFAIELEIYKTHNILFPFIGKWEIVTVNFHA